MIPAKPEVLVVGTGTSGLVDVPDATREFVEAKGIELRVLRTEDACRLYNQLAATRKVVAALHLTC